jgi:hypothetical protein
MEVGILHADAVQQQQAASIHTTRCFCHKLVGKQRLDGLICLRIKRDAGGGAVRVCEKVIVGSGFCRNNGPVLYTPDGTNQRLGCTREGFSEVKNTH